MRHLICDSVYAEDFSIASMIPSEDGVELLTGYGSVPSVFADGTVSVHLPYSTDWYGIWSGKRKVSSDVDEGSIPFMYYGADRKEIVNNIVKMIRIADELHPPYGVFHACSANFDELMERNYSETDSEVLTVLADILNEVSSPFGGEMPFPLALENLWWPGMRMTDSSGYRFLENHLEFDNWCICLDTGHLLLSLGGSYDEEGSIELLNKVIDSYPKDMIDRICAMHLHNNTSKSVLESHVPPEGFRELGHMKRYSAAYSYICSIDQHRPFTNPEVVDFAERISPEYVNHEMGAPDPAKRVSDYMIQRSLFGRS